MFYVKIKHKAFYKMPLKTLKFAMKWLPHKVLGGKTVKNVQIVPETTEILPKKLKVP